MICIVDSWQPKKDGLVPSIGLDSGLDQNLHTFYWRFIRCKSGELIRERSGAEVCILWYQLRS